MRLVVLFRFNWSYHPPTHLTHLAALANPLSLMQ